MNNMQCFINERFGQVRIIVRDDEPWFVAKDVAACIEYKDTSTMVRLCREKDIYVTSASDFDSADLAESGNSRITLISESGLYRILAKCNLPKGEPFEQWVFDDVIPSVRKYGVYATPQAIESLTAEELMARAVLAAQETIDRIKAERDEAIRTKYQIVEGRNASLMGKVGGLSYSNKRLKNEIEGLKEQIGDATNWKAGKAVPWTKKYFNTKKAQFDSNFGKALTKVSKELFPDKESNFNIRQMEDSEYGHINLYHISVIDELRRRLDLDVNKKILPSYRLA